MAHAQGFLFSGLQPLALGSLEGVCGAKGAFDVTANNRERCSQLMAHSTHELALMAPRKRQTLQQLLIVLRQSADLFRSSAELHVGVLQRIGCHRCGELAELPQRPNDATHQHSDHQEGQHQTDRPDQDHPRDVGAEGQRADAHITSSPNAGSAGQAQHLFGEITPSGIGDHLLRGPCLGPLQQVGAGGLQRRSRKDQRAIALLKPKNGALIADALELLLHP